MASMTVAWVMARGAGLEVQPLKQLKQQRSNDGMK